MFHEENWITSLVGQALQTSPFSSKSYKKHAAHSPEKSDKPSRKAEAVFSSHCFIATAGSATSVINFVATYTPQIEQVARPIQSHTNDQRAEDLQSYVEKLKVGFTRFPNSVLMQMINGDLSKTEIRVLLLIARLTISFKDSDTGKECKFASISKRTLAEYTGVNSKTILATLASLEAHGLIRKIQGTHLEKNQFGLVYQDGLFDRKQPFEGPIDQALSNPHLAPEPAASPTPQNPPNPPKEHSVPVETAPQGNNCTQGWGEKCTQTRGGKSTQGEGRKCTHYKQYDLNNILNDSLNHLSKEDPSYDIIHSYFQGLELEGKRVSELEKYQTLSQSYPVEDVATALGDLIQFGIPETGASCHSPMAYLSKAMGPVLEVAMQRREKARKRVEAKKQEDENKKQQEAEERKDAKKVQENKTAFQKAFPTPDSQREYFKKISTLYPFSSIDSPYFPTIAASYWAQEVKSGAAV